MQDYHLGLPQLETFSKETQLKYLHKIIGFADGILFVGYDRDGTPYEEH